MKKVTIEYICDICSKRPSDRHFKIKIPVPDTNLKKWKRIDICSICYFEFYNMCTKIKEE